MCRGGPSLFRERPFPLRIYVTPPSLHTAKAAPDAERKVKRASLSGEHAVGNTCRMRKPCKGNPLVVWPGGSTEFGDRDEPPSANVLLWV